jgi:hypothetical protein
LSCILDSPDGDPAACFNINPEDSWLDVPSKWKTKPALTHFPLVASDTVTSKAPAKKLATAKKTTVKKAVAATKKVDVKVTRRTAIKRK